MPRWVYRALEVAAWLALAPMLGLCITQWFGIEGRRTVAAFQALTPWVLAGAIPIAIAAEVTRRHPLALVSLIPIATLLALSYPIVFHGDAPRAAADSPHFTVGYSNLLASNPMAGEATAVLTATDADVLVLVEYTHEFQRTFDEALGDDYPYRAAEPRGGFVSTGGVAVYSRLPIVSGGIMFMEGRPAVDVILDVGGVSVRVLGVHPYPPTTNAPGWKRQLTAIGESAATSVDPTVIIGDYNATRWHPSYRALLDRGWRDTHEVLGAGWSVSWPMDEGLLPPPFVRLDHALFGDGIAPIRIDDLDVPGSDHKGFVVEFGFTDTAVDDQAAAPPTSG